MLTIRASLKYRKIDQYLINFVFGEDTELTSPIVTMATDEQVIRVRSD